MLTPLDVLRFWFGKEYGDMDALNEVDYIVSRMPLWFGGASSEFDQTQRDCKELLNMPGLPNSGCNDIGDSCRSNSFDGAWMVPDARTCLARVILFDQFPRCISRGTSSAFKYEDTAIGAVQIDHQWLDWFSIASLFKYWVIIHYHCSPAFGELSVAEVGVWLRQPAAVDTFNCNVHCFFWWHTCYGGLCVDKREEECIGFLLQVA